MWLIGLYTHRVGPWEYRVLHGGVGPGLVHVHGPHALQHAGAHHGHLEHERVGSEYSLARWEACPPGAQQRLGVGWAA